MRGTSAFQETPAVACWRQVPDLAAERRVEAARAIGCQRSRLAALHHQHRRGASGVKASSPGRRSGNVELGEPERPAGFAAGGPPSAGNVAGPGPINHPATRPQCPRPRQAAVTGNRCRGGRRSIRRLAPPPRAGTQQNGRWATRVRDSGGRSARSAVRASRRDSSWARAFDGGGQRHRALSGFGHSDGRRTRNTGCERLRENPIFSDPQRCFSICAGKKALVTGIAKQTARIGAWALPSSWPAARLRNWRSPYLP